MSEQNEQQKNKNLRLYWILALVFSVLFHIGLLYYLNTEKFESADNSLPEGYIKLEIPEKKDEIADDKNDESKRILETPLAPTQPPPDADFLGQTDHQAKKLMKVKPHEQEKAKDPGLQKKSPAVMSKTAPGSLSKGEDVPNTKILNQKKDSSENGPFHEEKERKRGARNGYESLVAEASEKLAESEMNQGYMDHLSDMVEEGETIDMNTREYRFIGYFTGLRKAIELVWNYPMEAARRGITGNVHVKFIILSDGKLAKIQVLESSGHNMLDSAIVDAIRSAAPYAPLPKSFHKDRLVVSGMFNYVLTY